MTDNGGTTPQPPSGDATHTTSDAAGGPAAAPVRPSGPNRNVIIGAIAAVAVLIVVLVIALGGGGDDDSDDAAGGSDTTSQATSGDGDDDGTTDGDGGETGPTVPGIDTVSPVLAAAGSTFGFSPDGTQLVVGGADAITTWDLASGTQKLTISSKAQSVQFSHDAQTLFSYMPGDGSHSWRTSDGQQVSQIQRAGEVSPEVNPVGTSKGAVLVPLAEGIGVFNLRTAKLDTTILLPGPPTGLLVSAGGGTTVANVGGGVYVFDTGSGGLQFQATGSGDCSLAALEFSADSKLLLGVDTCAGNLVVWNPNNGAEVARLGDLTHFGAFAGFTPDAANVISCGIGTGDGVACQVWAVAGGAAGSSLATPELLPSSYADGGLTADLSADGLWLAVSFDNGTGTGWTAVYNMFTGSVERVANGLSQAQMSPDGSKLVGVDSATGEVKVFALDALPTGKA